VVDGRESCVEGPKKTRRGVCSTYLLGVIGGVVTHAGKSLVLGRGGVGRW
jgi:hypothetical protein